MKRIIIGICIGLCIAIIIVSLFIMFYFKKSENKNMLNTQNIDVLNNENIDTSNIENNTQENLERFQGKTSKEWEERIKEYHTLNNLDSFEKIECYYNDDDNFTITVSTQYEVCAEYVFDKETGYAKEIFSQDIIDFNNNKVIEKATKTIIDFQDKYVLGVGYVSDRGLDTFINDYFINESFYNSLDVYDYRDNKVEGNGNRFVIVPKSTSVKVSLYTCKLGDDGRIKKDKILIEETDEPFIIYDEYIETMPRLMLEYKYEHIGAEFPLIFDGMSGELLLEDSYILNISIY